MIGIVNYNAGNIKSVCNALEYIGGKYKLIQTVDDFKGCDKIILPGVGAFSNAMNNLKINNLDEGIKDFVKSGKYFLGICLGLQLLFDEGDEFTKTDGLGIIPGKVIKFDKSKFETPLKIPHTGWNTLHFIKNSALNNGFNEYAYLYFVHSYHVICDEKYALSKTNYGYDFISSVAFENVFGIQAHPEKSHENGMKILKNFLEL